MVKGLVLSLLSAALFASTTYATEYETANLPTSESRIDMSEIEKPTFSNINLNVALGMSSFDYSGDGAKSRSDQGMASSLTVDLGDRARFLETGLMFYQSKAQGLADSTGNIEEMNNSHIAIPLLAKGYFNGGSDGIYVKGGMLTSFLTSSSKKDDVRKIDLVGTLGLGGKFKMNQKTNFLVEGMYNRGFLDQLPARGDTVQQGFVLMGGVSFKL